jgi:uncharacterized protein (TIGR02099 family)
LESVRFSWRGSPLQPQSYEAQGRWLGAAVQAGPVPPMPEWGRPGFNNADIDFKATHEGGTAQIRIKDGAMHFPGVFDAPSVSVQDLDTQVEWRIQPAGLAAQKKTGAGTLPKIVVNVPRLNIRTDDFKGQLSATWQTGTGQGLGLGGRFPGVLNLTGKLQQARIQAIARYLPMDVPVAARNYVAAALRKGTVTQADFKVQGDLWAFPFGASTPAGRGLFQVDANLSQVEMAYVPAAEGDRKTWPVAQQIDGRLRFLNDQLSLIRLKGNIAGHAVTVPEGRVQFSLDRPQLKLNIQSRGPGQSLMGYVQNSPIDDELGGTFAQSSLTGPTQLEMQLDLPILKPTAAQWNGFVQFLGNDFRIQPDLPELTQTRGRVNFSNQGFQVLGMKGQALGGEFSMDGGSMNRQGIQMQGRIKSDYLQTQWKGVGASLARFGQGEMPYRLQLQFPQGRPQISWSSSMVGMAVRLPAPFAKEATQARPLLVQWVPQSAAANGAHLSALQVHWGSVLHAQYELAAQGGQTTVVKGGVHIADPDSAEAAAALPHDMAYPPVAKIQLRQLDLDAWRQVWSAQGASQARGGSQSLNGMNEWIPAQTAMQVKQLNVAGRLFDQVDLTLERKAAGWDVRGQAQQFKGQAQWRASVAGKPDKLTAQLATLYLPRSETPAIPEPQVDMDDEMPALDISVDDFEMAGKKLGRLELEAAYQKTSPKNGQSIWQLNKLTLNNGHARLDATGRWMPQQAQNNSKTELDFRLDVKNAGELVQALGMGAVIKRGRGHLQGMLSWPGSPMGFQIKGLDGQMLMEVESGQFLKLDAGAGRLLGILSLQSLPRRLILDFRDVFLEGFAFDNISGDIQLENGVASTNNLRMRSVQAAALLEGRADINHETQDIRVVVVPEINAGTASLAYATINPMLGLGSFLAQVFLRKPLAEANTREFHITGSWDDPQVEEIGRDEAKPAAKPAKPITSNTAPNPKNVVPPAGRR